MSEDINNAALKGLIEQTAFNVELEILVRRLLDSLNEELEYELNHAQRSIAAYIELKELLKNNTNLRRRQPPEKRPDNG